MRAFLLASFFLLGSPMLWSQTTGTLSTDIDPRLYEVYESDYLNRIQQNHPVQLQRMNFFLDHAFYLVDYPTNKGFEQLPSIAITDLEKINIYSLMQEFGMVRDFKTEKAYRIQGTQKALVFYSGKAFTQAFNQSRTNLTNH